MSGITTLLFIYNTRYLLRKKWMMSHIRFMVALEAYIFLWETGQTFDIEKRLMPRYKRLTYKHHLISNYVKLSAIVS